MDNKEIDKEFHRIVECLEQQGDLDCIEDIIPTKIKKEFIDDWKDEGDETRLKKIWM